MTDQPQKTPQTETDPATRTQGDRQRPNPGNDNKQWKQVNSGGQASEGDEQNGNTNAPTSQDNNT